jgi:hypothetical protein
LAVAFARHKAKPGMAFLRHSSGSGAKASSVLCGQRIAAESLSNFDSGAPRPAVFRHLRLPPGQKHRHGVTDDGLSHIAIQEALPVDWMEKVSDRQYRTELRVSQQPREPLRTAVPIYRN